MVKRILKIVLGLALTCNANGALNGVAHAANIQLPQTGQTTCYDGVGAVISCTGTGQDGELKTGVAWPNPRFTDNSNGTVTDNLTGLVWLKNANCTDTVGGVVRSNGYLNWDKALIWSNNLANGSCGLSDGSVAGDWRLPNINELKSLVDEQTAALPPGSLFIYPVAASENPIQYWSSTTDVSSPNHAWYVLQSGEINSYFGVKVKHYNCSFAWPVRN